MRCSSDLKKCKNSNFLKQYSYVEKRVNIFIEDVYASYSAFNFETHRYLLNKNINSKYVFSLQF